MNKLIAIALVLLSAIAASIFISLIKIYVLEDYDVKFRDATGIALEIELYSWLIITAMLWVVQILCMHVVDKLPGMADAWSKYRAALFGFCNPILLFILLGTIEINYIGIVLILSLFLSPVFISGFVYKKYKR